MSCPRRCDQHRRLFAALTPPVVKLGPRLGCGGILTSFRPGPLQASPSFDRIIFRADLELPRPPTPDTTWNLNWSPDRDLRSALRFTIPPLRCLSLRGVERVSGFAPEALSLAKTRSTPELNPHGAECRFCPDVSCLEDRCSAIELIPHLVSKAGLEPAVSSFRERRPTS